MGKVDFRQQRADILSRLDILQVLKSLGVRLVSDSPDASGWIKCHAVGRDDETASAAVNITGKNAEPGYYVDHGGGGRLSLFDLAATVGAFPDWRAAYNHYAESVGIQTGKRSGGNLGPVIAEYVYHDQNGNPLFKSCKHDRGDGKKTFRQYGLFAGDWRPTTKGLKLVPYRLPELLSTPKPGPILIAEGEKDVDRLLSVGLPASCNVAGAKKFHKYLAEWFEGFDVILLADNDEAGEEHVQIAAANLHGVAASIRIVRFPELPEKGDVSDFFDQGGTVEQLREWAEAAEVWQPVAKATEGLVGQVDPVLFEKSDATDRRNAEILVELHGDNIRYCPQWKSWLVWDGKLWKRDDREQIVRKAHGVSDYWFAEAETVSGDMQKEMCLAHAQRSANTTPIQNFLKQARSMVPVDVSELNQNRWLLNVENGTIDLRTGELQPHRRGDLQTVICPTQFDPDSPSMTWDRFLESLYPDDQAMIDFLQRLFGSALAGEQLDHLLPILHGCGANGKSVMMNVLLETLGDDYAMTAPPNLLIDTGQERHLTELADLYGKRFVVTSETGEGRRLKEDLIKSLTGNDKVRARHLYEKHFEFRPEFLVVMVTNHRPRIVGTDEGVWRRVKMVPFERTFRGKDADPHLGAKLAKEYPGVLQWLIRGCLEWQQRGLDAPQAVEVASSEYRSENDVLGQFIESECYVNDGMSAKFSSLYEEFVKWCDENGENAMNRRKAGQCLGERFERVRNNGIWYMGIGLKS